MTRVLLVDDDVELCRTLELDLSARGYAVAYTHDAPRALAALAQSDFDVVVTDLRMPQVTGTELCREIVARRADIPVVVLTGFGNFDSAVEAIRAGAYDFISKPVQLEVLAIAIARAARHRSLREQIRRLERVVATTSSFPKIIGASAAMRSVFDLMERLATSEATTLITGESGTGKELVARSLHDSGLRREKPFIAFNCAAVPESLLESELFGHVRGAFTDARASEPGLFLAANGGTIFLDEIGDMPVALQPKLLRVLQERTVRPVGGQSERPVDVRVIAATNHDLESAIEEGRFREDLYYRINVVGIPLPPLRARVPDILPLAQSFVVDFATRSNRSVLGIAPAAAERLLAYSWPGNIRELQNCMERAVALSRYEQISIDDLPEKIREHRTSQIVFSVDDPSELVPLEQVERQYIARVMVAVAGNKSAAARVLGLDRKRLYRMLDRLGLDGQPTESRR